MNISIEWKRTRPTEDSDITIIFEPKDAIYMEANSEKIFITLPPKKIKKLIKNLIKLL